MPEEIKENYNATYYLIEPTHTYDNNFPSLEIEERDSKMKHLTIRKCILCGREFKYGLYLSNYQKRWHFIYHQILHFFYHLGLNNVK